MKLLGAALKEETETGKEEGPLFKAAWSARLPKSAKRIDADKERRRAEVCSYAPVDSRNILARLTKALSQRLRVSLNEGPTLLSDLLPALAFAFFRPGVHRLPPINRYIFRIAGCRSTGTDFATEFRDWPTFDREFPGLRLVLNLRGSSRVSEDLRGPPRIFGATEGTERHWKWNFCAIFRRAM